MPDDLSTPVTRRKFLAMSLGAVAAATLAMRGCDTPPTPTPTKPLLENTLSGMLAPATEISSGSSGKLTTSLLVKMGQITLPGPTSTTTQQLNCRLYFSPQPNLNHPPDPGNAADWIQTLPGPTLRVKQGDQINIAFYNRLDIVKNVGECDPVPTPSDTAPDCFHDDNATNLHYHGLHVDQGLKADNVFIELFPQGQVLPPNRQDAYHGIGQWTYDFTVPATHPQGTFWYHPHKHGASAIQAANGMAGVLIVEDSLAADPAFNGQLQEQLIVIQAIQQQLSFPSGGPRTITMNGQAIANADGTRINGVALPQLMIKEGEVQRWRIVNAAGGDQNAYTIRFPQSAQTGQFDVYPIAADGYWLPPDRWTWVKNNPAQWLFLAPSNRIDVLVVGRKAGPAVTLQGRPRKSPSSSHQLEAAVDLAALQVLVTSDHPAKPMSLPATLPALLHDQRPFNTDQQMRRRQIVFALPKGSVGGAGSGNGPKYAIGVDGNPPQQFDPGVVNLCVDVNTEEEWTITNTTGTSHPFHIHLNPFYITAYQDPNPPVQGHDQPDVFYNDPVGLWQDTIYIPGMNNGTPGQVTFKTRFPDITGTFVMHCHLLGHEDRGFMAVVKVRGPGEDCNSPVPHPH